MVKSRLKEVRQATGKSLMAVATELNAKPYNVKVTDGALSRYENDTRQPKPHIWEALADYYGVSVPYLQGYDNPLPQDAIDIIARAKQTLSKEQADKIEEFYIRKEIKFGEARATYFSFAERGIVPVNVQDDFATYAGELIEETFKLIERAHNSGVAVGDIGKVSQTLSETFPNNKAK